MARGPILSARTRAAVATSFITKLPLPQPKSQNPLLSNLLLPPYGLSTRSFRCKCSVASAQRHSIEMAKYRDSFSQRMAMAGLKPHHRIAIGVSGGPDSMALCVLTAGWKTDDGLGKSDGGYIDGVLGIIVDHGLRTESSEEAHIVSRRVSEMGIRCEIAQCEWLDGKPKQGHFQEEAREMRYQIFQNVCTKHQMEVLLIAHHADDQAELFILRLSRNSGVLGLAGMAFTAQMFSKGTHLCGEGSKNNGFLVVRPLLHFSKGDMYKICEGSNKEWVEDPTNQSTLYARNRIRMSLGNFSSYTFHYELQAVIYACRRTRAYVDHICYNLINEAVTIIDQGYAILDLEVLNPSKVPCICLSKFVALILQYVSQRHRPVRGSTSKLLLDYIRSVPCKTSITAAGCYLCPAPRSRGTKILVCCSVNCPLPTKMELVHMCSIGEQRQHISSELEQIIADGKSYSKHFVPDASDVHFLDVTSESVLTEAKRLNIISESTYKDLLLLKMDEINHFKHKTEDKIDYKPKDDVDSIRPSPSEPLLPGKVGYFMNRFLITWKMSNYIAVEEVPENNILDFGGESQQHRYCSCGIAHGIAAEVRHMIESDWLYLAKLSSCPSLDNLHQQTVSEASKMEGTTEERNLHLKNLGLSAQKALQLLKSISIAARRSLPVLVSHQGKLLSIPSIGFKSCSCLVVSCEFKPRVPLGGGHSSFM